MRNTVDAHTHIYPRPYVDLLKSRQEPPCVVEEGGAEYLLLFDQQRGLPATSGIRLGPSFTDADEKLRFMDSMGIGKSIVSVGNPWLDPFPSANSGELARSINEEMATYESTTAGRIVGMGVLPAGEVKTVIEVAAEISDDSRLYGVVVGSRIAGRRLDDPALEQLWATAAARELPILVHPHYSAAGSELTGYGAALPVAIGNPFEITIAVARLILAGVLNRHPRLKLIVSHGGGTLPYLAARLDAAWRSNAALHDQLPEAPSKEMRKLFLDTILFHERAMGTAVDLVGVSHMMFGTDHPFTVADPAGNMSALTAAFGADELEEVLAQSAEAVFGLAT